MPNGGPAVATGPVYEFTANANPAAGGTATFVGTCSTRRADGTLLLDVTIGGSLGTP